MTKIAISPNASGTGTFTLAAPDSNTNRTLTLPDAGGSVVLNEGSGTFKIDSTGNVGIGTNSPDTKLDVRGFARFGPADDSSVFQGVTLAHGKDSSATSSNSFLDARNNLNVADAHIFMEHQSNGGSSIKFGTTPEGSRSSDRRQERMRITSAGSVAIGTTNPVLSSKNHRTAIFSSTSAVLGVGTAGTTAFNMVTFHNGNGEVGFINTGGTTTSYNTSSDYRLKEDVQPMVGASDRVLSLNPCNFAWKVDGTRVDGFLAHEAQAVVPEAVHGTKDEVDADGNPMYQGIDQSKLVPLLTAALQEALADIATLKAEVAALKGVSA